MIKRNVILFFILINISQKVYSEIMVMKNTATNNHTIQNIQNTISAWQQFLKKNQWQELIAASVPLSVGCGLVYELPNFLKRANEDFAIVDMRNITVAEPHYHPDNDIEIYFVLQGTALVVVGGIEYYVTSEDVIIIPSQTAHFTIPDNDYVIAVVNTPPFAPERYIKLTESNELVGFCKNQFIELTNKHIQK